MSDLTPTVTRFAKRSPTRDPAVITELNLTHSEPREDVGDGWTFIVDRLAARFESSVRGGSIPARRAAKIIACGLLQ